MDTTVENAETPKTEKPKARFALTAKQRELLEAFKAEAGDNHTQFCRDYTTFSRSQLSQIFAALEDDKESYFDKISDPEVKLAEIEALLKALPQMRAQKALTEGMRVLPISQFEAVVKACRQCKDKRTPERLVYYIAPTGGGKSVLFSFLEEKLGVEFALAFVNCRDAWRPVTRDMRQSAKRVVLLDICQGLGLRLGEAARRESVPQIEDRLVTRLGQNPTLLFIEEGRFLSAYALNLFIDLLNRTRAVIVLTSTPFAASALRRYYPDEADQLNRRSHSVVALNQINPDDASLFFAANQFAQRDAALESIAVAATKFGHYSLLNRIRKQLEKRSGPAGEGDVKEAIKRALKQVNQTN